jgi:DNA polymerase
LDDAFALLRLQIEWGADEALDPEPVDHLRPVVQTPGPTRPLGPAIVRSTTADTPIASRGTPAEQAIAIAGQAASLDALREALAAFDGCALRDTASHLVFAEGNPASTTLIIGEPPGREEDRTGHPFAGPDGALLDQMLGSIGVDRGSVMLTPLLPWRPPGGRPPNPAEIAICLPFLHRLIGLLEPRRLLLFGGTAARTLLPPALARRRPTPEWTGFSIPGLRSPLSVLVLPSLSEMQKSPPLRRTAWTGMRLLRRAMDAEIPPT